MAALAAVWATPIDFEALFALADIAVIALLVHRVYARCCLDGRCGGDQVDGSANAGLSGMAHFSEGMENGPLETCDRGGARRGTSAGRVLCGSQAVDQGVDIAAATIKVFQICAQRGIPSWQGWMVLGAK